MAVGQQGSLLNCNNGSPYHAFSARQGRLFHSNISVFFRVSLWLPQETDQIHSPVWFHLFASGEPGSWAQEPTRCQTTTSDLIQVFFVMIHTNSRLIQNEKVTRLQRLPAGNFLTTVGNSVTTSGKVRRVTVDVL